MEFCYLKRKKINRTKDRNVKWNKAGFKKYLCCIYRGWNTEKIKDMEIKRDGVLEKMEDISRSMEQD